MRGGCCHNQYMAKRLREGLRRIDFLVVCEFPVRPGRHAPCFDLFSQTVHGAVGIECQTDAKRVQTGIEKATVAKVRWLIFVASNARVARALKRQVWRIEEQGLSPGLSVSVLTLGAALHLLRQKDQFVFELINKTRTPVKPAAVENSSTAVVGQKHL